MFKPYGEDFGEDIPYIEIEDKKYAEKENWEIGFGLQAADSLKPSSYALELAEKNYNGKLSFEEVVKELKNYHSSNKTKNRQSEADISAARITEILTNGTFRLSPSTLKEYHNIIFQGIEDFKYPVGEFRKTNLLKEEDVLNNTSVEYVNFASIKNTLEYDFDTEKEKSYTGLNKFEIVKETTKFISGIWQIHPFREGNTRTIATFCIMYLRQFGFKVDNKPFFKNAKYFRDSLVLSNAPRNFKTNIFLNKFMQNAFLNTNHILSEEEILDWSNNSEISDIRKKIIENFDIESKK
ncbi:MAG: Fic family protein [Defluviitaleaceae bacterium]|nr:Fic family protein [Defluviitaleaceae bacterium]